MNAFGFAAGARSLLLALALLTLAAAGCGRFGGQQDPATPVPPDYIKVTGSGKASPRDQASSRGRALAGAMSGPIKADSAAPVDGSIKDPAERLLMARSRARLNALRTLGQVIMAQRDLQGRTIGETLKSSPVNQSKLNLLLAEKAQVVFEEDADSVHATAVIDGRQVVETLGLMTAQPEPAASPAPATSLEGLKAVSYNLALENAKTKLEETLLGQTLPDGQLVRDVIAKNPQSAVDLKATIFALQPDEIRYGPDGSCEVVVFFDKNRLPELVKPRVRWWWPF